MDPLITCGRPAPSFTLPDLDGKLHRLEGWREKLCILIFWSAECPWSARADRDLLAALPGWGEAAVLLPIAANRNEPLALLARTAAERGLPLVLHDAEGEVAGRYGALTTPHAFLVDREGILVYQGGVDDVTFRRRSPTRFYLREAIEAALAGRRPEPQITAPYGCTIARY